MESEPPQPLSRKERREKERRDKSLGLTPTDKKRHRARIVSRIIFIGIATIVVGGFGLIFLTPSKSSSNLPPTSMQGHIESNLKAHIVDTAIPDAIQRHMLEHADGKDKPGIIIQYNCEKYKCEPDLISKLTAFVRQYPNNVYLAPGNYEGKIILTKMNKLQILDTFDEQAIKSFIGT